jgi:hypothetical protein
MFGDGGVDPVVSISITPQNPTIEVLNGVVPMATPFVATGLTKGGGTVPVSGSWTYDQLAAATINPATGAFTATGLVGAAGTVTFTANGLTATTKATVKLHYTQNPGMVPSSTITMFGQASAPDPALQLLYPYDKTVFPRGLAGPVIQWNGGAAADIYYVHAQSPTFEYELWGTIPPPSRFSFPTMPDDIWKKLTDSTTGNITVSIQRNDGSQPYTATTRTWTIAPANLTGTIYYWAVNSGNVMRIQPGATSSQAFLEMPSGVSCIACHSVAKGGSRIVASFNGSASPWGTFDAPSGGSLYASGTDPSSGTFGSGFQAISPDGNYVLWGQWNNASFTNNGLLTLSDYNDVTPLATLSPGGGAPVYPAWSGDSGKIAFAVRTDGNGLDFNTATLWTTDVDLQSHLFSNTHQVVANTSTRSAVVYPTWSPDSQWLAFERSTQARSRGALGDIWISAADGSSPVALDQANGTGLLTGTEISSTYEPTFLPVAVGGYFWLVVVSERTYGNTLTELNRTANNPDPNDPNQRTKQLWVTAIDATITPGQDPSHPAFWLPGQDLTTNNMRGEWALSPCKMLGDTCSAGYDCCGGFCKDNGMGMLTCSDQSGGCSMLGDNCTTAADCCDPSANCTGGFCASTQAQ